MHNDQIFSNLSAKVCARILALKSSKYVRYFADAGGPGSNGWGVLFYLGESNNFILFQARKFSKNVKKSMKTL